MIACRMEEYDNNDYASTVLHSVLIEGMATFQACRLYYMERPVPY